MEYEAAAPTAASGSIRLLVRALAGLRGGIIAGLLILGWILVATLLVGRPLWLIPNVLAALFYGSGSVRSDFGLYTCAGVALHLIQCALAGIVWAVAVPRVRWPGGAVLAMGYSLAGLALANRFWKQFNPYLLDFTPSFMLWGGFMILAICLSLLPWQVNEMEKDFLLK